jgi:hypothetical protein
MGSAACGGGDAESDTQASTSASETTSEAAETSTSSPATTSRSTSTSSSSASASSTDDGGVLDEEDEGRELGLDDYFNADAQWEERRYDLADQQDVPGVGSMVQGCGQSSSYDRTLELRLGNNFRELTFSAAQANNSLRSDQNLVVEILANNEQRDIRSVPFNQTQEFTIDVTGVNALVLRLYLDDEVADCRPSVVGVISEATVN